MNRRTLLVIASSITTGLVATGCAGTTGEGAAGAGGKADYAVDGTFTMALFDDIGSFDPYHSLSNLNVVHLAYDSLVNLQVDGTYVSGLAETWEADATSATFTLREDVTCSDGKPLAASDVVAAIDYVKDPDTASPMFGWTVPAVPFSASADDSSRTVTIKLDDEPFGFLLNTFGQLPIVCGAGLSDPKALETASQGTGPFVLTKVVPGQSYTLTRRDGYTWGPDGATNSDPGSPKTVVLRVIANETTSSNLLLSGEINYADINGVDRERLDAQGLQKIETASPGGWLWFNQLGGRDLADKELRQALVHATDLEQATKVNTGGAGDASTGLIVLEPAPCPGDTVSGQLPGYDVAAAEAMLDEAGWVMGSDGVRSKNGRQLTISLHYPTYMSPFDEPTAEFLAQQWREVGVDVKLTGASLPEMSETLYSTSDYDAQIFGATFPLPTQAQQFLSGPFPPAGTNFAGIDNPDYAEFAAKARTMVVPEACEYWDQAEQALFQNVDVVPISNVSRASFFQGVEVGQASGWKSPIPTSIRVLD